MAVYHDARCRLCRREGIKLMLKGERCLTDKCAVERRAYAPGEHGKGRRVKETNYGLQLREKQKARRIYGVLERQFRNYFHKAEKGKGVTGETLLQMLEMRVDNILYRLRFPAARPPRRPIPPPPPPTAAGAERLDPGGRDRAGGGGPRPERTPA